MASPAVFLHTCGYDHHLSATLSHHFQKALVTDEAFSVANYLSLCWHFVLCIRQSKIFYETLEILQNSKSYKNSYQDILLIF